MWDILSKILNIILGVLTIYLYLENKKLKDFEIDKNINLKEIEIRDLELWRRKQQEKIANEMAEKGFSSSGINMKAQGELEGEYKNKRDGLEAELTYLKRLKNINGFLVNNFLYD